MKTHKIAVVIPAYKVRRHILGVISAIGPEVFKIYVIDDCCPERSGDFVEQNSKDNRVSIIRHLTNIGVGGAVMSGYAAAIDDGIDICIKIDGDGQMDPRHLMDFAWPIIDGDADYTKGNRFFNLGGIRSMPNIRIFGNTILSFLCKLSSGYWNIFDSTNGYTGIHINVVAQLPFNSISKRYFFESDMLFRLNIIRAVVVDIPMNSKYVDEISGIQLSQVTFEFLLKHIRNSVKRIFYNYYLRDMSLASFELPLGLLMLIFGIVHGGYYWIKTIDVGIPTATGTIVLSALSILTGIQLLLAFIGTDTGSIPVRAIHKKHRLSSSINDHINGK